MVQDVVFQNLVINIDGIPTQFFPVLRSLMCLRMKQTLQRHTLFCTYMFKLSITTLAILHI